MKLLKDQELRKALVRGGYLRAIDSFEDDCGDEPKSRLPGKVTELIDQAERHKKLLIALMEYLNVTVVTQQDIKIVPIKGGK